MWTRPTGRTPCYQRSLHAEAIKRGVKDSAHCSDCHGSHYIYPKGHILSKVNPLNLEETCDRCHADVAFVREHRGIPDRVLPGVIYKESVHGRAVKRGIAGAATCSDCHSSHNLKGPLDSESLISRQNVSSTCGRCHPRAFEEYEGSIHGVAAKRGVGRSPVCTDCHGIHSIKAKVDPASPVAEQKVAMTTCPQCHGAEWISKEYGVSTLKVKSYLDSYHGLAKKGGDVVAANCASCHGVHDIRPSSDPKSMIHKSSLVKTCGRCHPGASENFAAFPVHFTPSTTAVTVGDHGLRLEVSRCLVGGHFLPSSGKPYEEPSPQDSGSGYRAPGHLPYPVHALYQKGSKPYGGIDSHLQRSPRCLHIDGIRPWHIKGEAEIREIQLYREDRILRGFMGNLRHDGHRFYPLVSEVLQPLSAQLGGERGQGDPLL